MSDAEDSDQELLDALEASVEHRPSTNLPTGSNNAEAGGSGSSGSSASIFDSGMPPARKRILSAVAWSCEHCTFRHEGPLAQLVACSICEAPRETATIAAATSSATTRCEIGKERVVQQLHAPPPDPYGPCRLYELPEELQRRVLKFVSIANLMMGFRTVSRHASVIALAEVRERIRSLLFDALVSGFETELAPAAAAAPADPAPAAAAAAAAHPVEAAPLPAATAASLILHQFGLGSSWAAPPPDAPLVVPAFAPAVLPPADHSQSSSRSNPTPAAAAVPRRDRLPERARLLALSEQVEHELTSLAAGRSESDRVRTLTSKTRSICFNLSDGKNPELRARLLHAELTPAALVRLGSQEMASGSLRAQRDEWHAKRLKCAIRPKGTLGYTTNLYRCEGCGSRQTRVHRSIRAGQHQVDRARTYVTCVDCSNRWEEGGM